MNIYLKSIDSKWVRATANSDVEFAASVEIARDCQKLYANRIRVLSSSCDALEFVFALEIRKLISLKCFHDLRWK